MVGEFVKLVTITRQSAANVAFHAGGERSGAAQIAPPLARHAARGQVAGAWLTILHLASGG